jgi:hypothetical protein
MEVWPLRSIIVHRGHVSPPRHLLIVKYSKNNIFKLLFEKPYIPDVASIFVYFKLPEPFLCSMSKDKTKKKGKNCLKNHRIKIKPF